MKAELNYILAVVVIVLGVAFYWYEYRPTVIRKECNILAIEEADSGPSIHRDEKYKVEYEKCLNSKGL